MTEWLGPGVVHLAQRIFGEDEHGLSIDADEPFEDAEAGWVFEGKAYVDLKPSPEKLDRAELDSWAEKNGGTPVSQRLDFILHGKSDKTVTVKQFEPVVDCGPSVEGVYVRDDAYVSLLPRTSAVLQADADPPKITFKNEKGDLVESPKYAVTQSDPEPVTLLITTTSSRCEWSLVVHWSVGAGKDHKTRIPKEGQYVVTGFNRATEHRKVDGTVLHD
ncbi:hypothetical protein ACTMTU_34275 [Streptomyces sp. OZ13]|uniref:hypothetical protein n=1 Tax=Streptomyces sp. OZ13 TaxID=3452210 RepID=UPI003F8A46AF